MAGAAKLYVLTLYFQDALGGTPLQAGLLFVPMTFASVVASPVAGRLTARLGYLSLIPGLPPFNTGVEAGVYPVLGPRGARRLSALYCGSLIASGAHSLAAVPPPPSRQASCTSQPAVNLMFPLKGSYQVRVNAYGTRVPTVAHGPTATCMMFDPLRNCPHESVFGGSQAEGVGCGRSRDASRGGSADLRDLLALDQALAKETKGDGAGRGQESARPTVRQRSDARGVAARSSSFQPRPHAGGALRGLRGGSRGKGVDGHHEPWDLFSSGGVAAQKKSPLAKERDEQLRGLWRWLASRFDAGRLVFVDESGFHTSMTRLRARAPKGERAYGKVPRNRGKNQTLIASLTLQGGMGASMSVEGATDSEVFEAYVERFLAPTLTEGQVVVLDKLGAHRTERVRELVEARGADLLFLPSYSPDLNPIEIRQPQCAFRHKLSYHWPRRAARATGAGREAPSRPYIRRRGGSAMSSRGAVPPRP